MSRCNLPSLQVSLSVVLVYLGIEDSKKRFFSQLSSKVK